MFAVVGCTSCHQLWIIAGEPTTTRCPRCGARHRTKRLKRFVETDDEDHARAVRASMLATQAGEERAFESLPSYSELESSARQDIVDDDEYLSGAGIDPEQVTTAGQFEKRVGRPKNQRESVLEALQNLDNPTEEQIIEFASEYGHPPKNVKVVLEQLTVRGVVSENNGRYRLL